MGRHRNVVAIQPLREDAGTLAVSRSHRRQGSLPLFSSFAALAFVLVAVTSPISQTQAAQAAIVAELEQAPAQRLVVAGGTESAVVRDSYKVTRKVIVVPKPAVAAASGGRSAPAAGSPDPGTAKAIAFDMVAARGWGQEQYDCLVALWNRESGWNVYAHNASSGAYGIPQSLPGSKMATAGADWATNPATQITWGLGYIAGRYSNPCGAWNASETKGWY